MIDNEFQEISQSHFGRKILQVNSSSSSFDTSQPSFIALLCIITILTVAFVITVIILCYRYYSHREKKSRNRHKYCRNRFQRILSSENNQPSTLPVSITPTTASMYSVRSSEHLFSNPHRQNLSINTIPSHRLQQSMIDAYLNDLNSFQPTTIDVKKLNSYLFIDLHSTSSETFPDNVSKQFTNTTMTSGYNTLTENKSLKKRRSNLKLKRSHNPRFLMRERSLPNNLHTLPQLRQLTTQQQRHLFGPDDTNNSSNTTIIHQDLQSTTLSTTTDDYDDSHAYNVNQNQIMHTIKEEKEFIVQQHSPHMSFDYEQEPYCFEIVSTSRDDYSDIQTPYKSSPVIDNRTAYINDSIIV